MFSERLQCPFKKKKSFMNFFLGYANVKGISFCKRFWNDTSG